MVVSRNCNTKDVDSEGGWRSIGPMKGRTSRGNLLPRRFCMVLSHLVEEVRRDFDALPGQPARSIHAIRTRMKNLRAILRLVKARVPKAPRKAIMTVTKRIKDALSGQRDAQVLAGMKAKMAGRRPTVRGGSASGAGMRVSSAISAELARLSRMVGRLRLTGLEWGEVIEAYVGSYREARGMMKVCLADSDPGQFHRWRRPVKDLFHQSRVLQPLNGMIRRVRLAQRLGDRLGKWNDLQLLADSAGAVERRRCLKRIEKKRKAMRPVIFKTAGKLFPDRPRELRDKLERCVRMLPAVAARCARQA